MKNFSVIETGGKQYKVAVGDVFNVELLGEHAEGDTLAFDKVLMTYADGKTTVGAPYVAGAKVTATYRATVAGPKLVIGRYKAKSNRDRKVGHRQHYARIEISSL